MDNTVSDIAITYSAPELADYMRLRREGGLSEFSQQAAELGLRGTIHAVTLRHSGAAIGMGRLIGDGGCFFLIVDIAVSPAWRGKGLGKLIMSELMTWANANLPESAFVSLFADVPADRLYAQYGFRETAPNSPGMSQRIRKG